MVDDTHEESDVTELEDAGLLDAPDAGSDTDEDTVDSLFASDATKEDDAALKEVQSRYGIEDPAEKMPEPEPETVDDDSPVEEEVADTQKAVDEASPVKSETPAKKVAAVEPEPEAVPQIPLDEDIIAPEVVTAIRAIEALNADLAKRLDGITKAQEGAAQAEYTARFDKMVVNEGKEYAELLGDKPLNELEAHSEEYRNREHVDVMMESIAATRAARGLKTLSESELFKTALHAQFPNQTEKIIRGELSGKLKKRAKLASNAPTHRKSKDMRSGRKKSEGLLNTMLHKLGVDTTPANDSLTDLYG